MIDTGTALYVRASTGEQDLAGQERELREGALQAGRDVTKVYAEKVTATGRATRAAFDQLMADARRPGRGWSHLMVWSLDRWTREPVLSAAIRSVEELEDLGIRFHSLKEPFVDTPATGDLNGQQAREFMLAWLALNAKFESLRRSQRTLVAMKEIKEGRRQTASGKPPGRPRRLTPELIGRIWIQRYVEGKQWIPIARSVHLPWKTCSHVRVSDGPPAGYEGPMPQSAPKIPRSQKAPAQFGERVGRQPFVRAGA